MQVLLMSPYPQDLLPYFHPSDYVTTKEGPSGDAENGNYDWVISYGCREIIKEPMLSLYKSRIVNLHMSYLPFNRGADPNFWSWLDNTPKGVTLHQIDAGIDTGPIYGQVRLGFRNEEKETLATAYKQLRSAAPLFFQTVWGAIRTGTVDPEPQQDSTYSHTHKSADKDKWMKFLPLGWDTPVHDVMYLRERIN